MLKLYSIVLFVITVSSGYLHPDIGLNILQLGDKHGYPIQSHEVETEDGYLLTLHYIAQTPKSNQKPVLLMHGIFSSSADWINMGPGKSLAMLLSDAGYDVWLGNQRGNTWSRKHKTLSPDKNPKEFFDFSFHEIGYYDLPAMIDYILKSTGADKVNYIGHSQGTTSFFVMASERPEYNEKIKLMTALAPVAYMGDFPNALVQQVLMAYSDLLEKVLEILQLKEILPHSEILTQLANYLCNDESEIQSFCIMGINFLVGSNTQLDIDFIPVMLSNMPAGASLKQLLHYEQGILSGEFALYDYNNSTYNLLKYKQQTPSLYNLTKITAPVSLRYSSNDLLTSVSDVKKLEKALPNVVNCKEVDMKNFNHLDFLFARDVDKLLYNDVIAEIGNFK